MTQSQHSLPIASVTLFRDRARVTRRGGVPLTQGSATLNIETDAKARIFSDSLRARVVHGAAQLVNVDLHTEWSTGNSVMRQEIQDEVDRASDAVAQMDDELTESSMQLGFVTDMATHGAEWMARAIAHQRTTSEAADQLVSHLGSHASTLLDRQRELRSHARKLQRALEAATAKQASLDQNSDRYERSLIAVELEAHTATDVTLEVTYDIAQASWAPRYDIRVEDSSITVRYMAVMTQSTGEAWDEVEVVLSTARSASIRAMGPLAPWYAALEAPTITRGGARSFAMMKQSESSDGMDDMAFAGGPPAPSALAAPSPSPPAPLVADVEGSGAAVTYRLPRRMSLPPDGRAQSSLILEFDTEAELDRVARPRLAPEVYLRGTAVNTSSAQLLPGLANVFVDGDFSGKTDIELTAPGQAMELQLGIDDRVVVKRDLAKRGSGKALIGATRTAEFGYSIEVTNLRDEKLSVTVQDQIPVAQVGDIKVKLKECSPSVTPDDTGVLAWHLTLGPKEATTLRFGFSIDHPAGSLFLPGERV